MASSPSSPTATVSVSRRATVVAFATHRPPSCPRATASRDSRASNVKSARPDFLDRRVNFAQRVEMRPEAHRGLRTPVASPAADEAGASATRDSPALEVARASRMPSPAPDAAREDVPRARSRAQRKTDSSTKPTASSVRRGTEATSTTIASSATGMSTQLRGQIRARHALRALFRPRERAVARSVLWGHTTPALMTTSSA